VPVLAGRHGLGASSAEMTAAYRAIGGGFDAWGRGAVDTARAFRDSAKMTDYSTRLKDRLATQPDGAELVDLYGEVERLGLVGQDAGMELQHRMERSEWLLGRGLDRMDHMARQMGTAVESVNRYVVGTTAYRLEKRRALKEGKPEAQARTVAKQYAIDTLYSTMGDYSAWNSPPLFNSPVGRMALQFKKYGQKIYQLLAMTAGQMRHSGEWNPEAIKAFGGVLATHALLAGTLGLPLEPIKAAAIIAGLLGGDMEYADVERRWREFLVDHLGADIGEIMARGVPRWAGVDMQRVGLDSLLLPMGEPKSSKAADIGQYVMQIAMGAPMSMVFEYPEAVEKLMKGDIMGGAAQLVPFKGAADALLAMQRLDQGKLTPGKKTAMDPYTPGEAFTRFLGFTPEREAETNDMRSFIQHEKAKRTKTRREEIADYVTAQTADEREAVWERIQDNNDSLPPVARLTLPMLAAAAERRNRERATGREQFGITIGPQERDLLTQAQRYYNVR